MNLPFPVHFFNIDVGESETLKDDINKAAVDKVAMPFHSEAPTGPVPKPQLGPLFELDNAVVNGRSRFDNPTFFRDTDPILQHSRCQARSL